MVKGLDTFQKYFADYEEQYVLIGGTACDILFESNEVNFRATRDLDYRFDKPEDDNFPKMIELFCRSDFKLKDAKGITPIQAMWSCSQIHT